MSTFFEVCLDTQRTMTQAAIALQGEGHREGEIITALAESARMIPHDVLCELYAIALAHAVKRG